MTITDKILAKTGRLQLHAESEFSSGDMGFAAFNDAGTEVEVSEFIYSFVRMLKPDMVLETGTHIGVSSTYIAQALEDNNRGTIATFEIIPQHFNSAAALFNEQGLSHRIQSFLMDAQQFDASGINIDFLFLDSEPQLRFDEFLKFYPNVRPGGFILIHDLHPSLGHSDQTHHGMYDWPYGDFRTKLGPFMKNHDIQTMSFPTPRGLTLFQKSDPSFAAIQYMRGEI